MEVKRFKGNPEVYVASEGNIIEVTTDEHMRMENKSLEQILHEVCDEAKAHAGDIFSKYSYPDGDWFPCGSADVVLHWNQHREIIKLFTKQATEKNGDFYNGWFGRMFKTGSQGWWWFPQVDQQSQSMRYEEEICRFIRDKLAFANIKVDVHTYID